MKKILILMLAALLILSIVVGSIACSNNDNKATSSDTTRPSISDVLAANITDTSATITWTTNEPATSQADYGETSECNLTTVLDENLVTSHSVSLRGLTANTTYHFRVKSKDEAGNEVVSEDFTFAVSDDGDGNEAPTITGEIIGFRTLVSELPTGTTSYKYYTPFIEDGDGNIFMLFAEGMSIDYEYDGMSMSGATIEIAGFTYSDTLSNCENINMGGITRRISHTGIQAAITGIIDTVTSGYMEFEGDRIHVETIDELP